MGNNSVRSVMETLSNGVLSLQKQLGTDVKTCADMMKQASVQTTNIDNSLSKESPDVAADSGLLEKR